ncbi:GDSL-type esterase/lipase family protein [Larkinella terrae]|uniref:GDSL-type esterase/lipase family protein n=1 Tax=Larkinella terrae TaxID=2025311 RepID=UPI00147863B8|nr:GDSL-type esterase/lipase family protein [Larkinella terrae]
MGTSITLGEELPPEKNYTKQLQDLLGGADTVRNFGVSGATILKKGLLPYWTESAYKNALQLNPRIVVIELGTNDSKSVNWKYKSEFKSNYVEFVRSFQALPSKPIVYICKPTPAFKAAYEINPDIIKNEINPLIDEVARETNVQVIDLYTPLVSSDALFRDGIHPNAEGAKMIAEIVRKAIRPN